MGRDAGKLTGGTAFLAALLAAAAALGAEPDAAAPFWPQFHGPNRDNIARDTGLLDRWPEGGPPLVWTAEGLGHGYASIAIAHGLIYVAGNLDGRTVLTALDLDGQTRWTFDVGPAWEKDYPGTRGCPTIDGDRLYYESPLGEVVCLDAKTGSQRWRLNLLKKYVGHNLRWGLCESLLVDGPNLICSPGGDQTAVVAMDKYDGMTVWKSPSVGQPPGYASPSLGEFQGLRMIFTTTAKAVIAVDAADGRLLWKFKHLTPFDENITMPLYHDGHVLVSTQMTGSVMLRIHVTGRRATVEEVWRIKDLDNHHGGVLLFEGAIYGTGANGRGARLACLDWQTGELLFREPRVRKGSVTLADGKLYCLDERRTVSLVTADPVHHEVTSQFRIPAGGEGPTWAHPVVTGGRLYVRHSGRLYAFDVRR